jgi:hypothetical protein
MPYCPYSLFQVQLEQLRLRGFECINEKLYNVTQLVKSDVDGVGECARCVIDFAMTRRWIVTFAYLIVPGVAGIMAFGSFKSMAASKIQILVLGTVGRRIRRKESFRCTERIRDRGKAYLSFGKHSGTLDSLTTQERNSAF